MSTDLEIPGDDRPAGSASPVFEAGATPKLKWHRPTITRVDIKRTLFFSGSHTDTSTMSPGNLT